MPIQTIFLTREESGQDVVVLGGDPEIIVLQGMPTIETFLVDSTLTVTDRDITMEIIK